MKSWWFICALASADSRNGINVLVDNPVAEMTYETLPITVKVRLSVTDGVEATRLRTETGTYEVCYGIMNGTEQITCLGVGDPVILEVPKIEAVHLANSEENIFVAWVQRDEFRVATTTVRFKTLLNSADMVEARILPPTKACTDEDGERDEEFIAEASAQFELGFVVLPSLVPRERALNIAGFLDEHVSVHGKRYANMFNGANMGGYYIADCFKVPELEHLLDVVTANRRLTDFLAAELGEDFHFLERSEIYVGRHVGWHSDVLYGPLQYYETHLDRTSYLDGRHWDKQPGDNQEGESQTTGSKIFTVAVYFRDHDEDDQGLTVIPYTHSNRSEWEQAEGNKDQKGVRVSTRAGDAVVFDSRLLHKGLDKSLADFVRNPGTTHRSLLSISFGRRDAISESFSRGFGFRTQLHHYNSKICPKRDKYGDANINWQCVQDAVRFDLVKRPMKGVPSGEPWLKRRALSNTVSSLAQTGSREVISEDALDSSIDFHGDQPGFKLSTGAVMPATAFGTAFRTATQVHAALYSGFRHLDLAEMYGNENELGGLFRHLGWDRDGEESLEHGPARADVFITSKVWATNLGAVREALDNTLEATGLAWLDCYLIHWPVPLHSVGVPGPSQGVHWPIDKNGNVVYATDQGPDGGNPLAFRDTLLMRAWRELELAFDEGKVRAIGVGNMPEALLEMFFLNARVKPHVHHFEAHPQLPQVRVLQYCLKYGIAPMAHSALGGGGGGFGTLSSDPTSREVMTEHALLQAGAPSFAQILVQWALHRNCGVVVSSGTDDHARELFEAAVAMSSSSTSSHRRASQASLDLLGSLPPSRHHRRHAPPPFAHLFVEPFQMVVGTTT